MKLKGICFSYGEKQVLKDLDFEISKGEAVALFGASGSGKTTLINIISGLLTPVSGTMEDMPEGISMVFQEDRLLPHLSAEENVALVSKLPREKIRELLAEIGLRGEENTLPGSLSGGMKRRVAIVRAIAYPQPLYIMDEPFKGLDEELRRVAAQFVLKHTKGSMLIFITHDPEEAELLSARSVYLNDINGKK